MENGKKKSRFVYVYGIVIFIALIVLSVLVFKKSPEASNSRGKFLFFLFVILGDIAGYLVGLIPCKISRWLYKNKVLIGTSRAISSLKFWDYYMFILVPYLIVFFAFNLNVLVAFVGGGK